MSKYSTTAGVPTTADCYTKLMHHMDEAADQAAVLSHLYNTEDDPQSKTRARMWLIAHERLRSIKETLRQLATGSLQ